MPTFCRRDSAASSLTEPHKAAPRPESTHDAIVQTGWARCGRLLVWQGSGADAESLVEDIYDGVVTIGDAYGEAPNVCFVGRSDYKLLRFARNDEGGAGTGSFLFGPPTKANPIEVEDCLVLPNFDLPAGISMMDIWREFAVWMHEGISIAMSDSHDTYFVENLVAILAELAAAAVAMETVAFCEISAGS